ncbi:MAG: DsbA family protein [Paenibacillus sp.]|nr:DsbA family protein [Paenibacillus sp.]
MCAQLSQKSAKSAKQSYKEQRKREQEKQQKLNRRLIWITVVSVIAIIALVIVFKPKPGPVDFAYDKLPMLGSKDAPVKIVEFGDFKCPACQYFAQEVKPLLQKDYIDKGLVSFHFMNYTFIGPDSTTAALAGLSAYHQSNDAFWKYYDALYKKQGNENVQWATADFLTELARTENVPLDAVKLKDDIQNKTYKSELDDHNAKGREAKITGTPSVFINGVMLHDSMDYNELKAAIDNALKGADE